MPPGGSRPPPGRKLLVVCRQCIRQARLLTTILAGNPGRPFVKKSKEPSSGFLRVIGYVQLSNCSAQRVADGKLRLYNHHTKEIQERRKNLIALLKPGAKADSLPVKIWNGARPEKWRCLHLDRPAYTILAQMHRDLSEWVHPQHQRWITVREAARLQSFRDGFIFKSSEWQMLKQVGNAVPPLLARALASAAERVLERLDNRGAGNVLPDLPYAAKLFWCF
jgi:site-specific DNA-cytosine methylase